MAQARAADEPMVTAWCIGGRADGWVCQMYGDADVAFVTMADGGPPKVPPIHHDRETLDLMRRARGHWELYTPIHGLARDEHDRIGYGVARALPDPAGQAAHITAELLSDVQCQLAGTDGPDSWAVLRQVLAAAGYVLPDQPTTL